MAAAEARRSQSSLGLHSQGHLLSRGQLVERQQSTDTTYNVPSISSEQVRFDRFDSIDEGHRRLARGANEQAMFNRFDSIDERGPGVENSGYSSGYL